MLSELRVRDFAIIDDLQVQLHPGFNVLTGETGAGKSIIIDAIELLMGIRASQEMVRAGAQIASIEGLFELDAEAGAQVQKALAEQGLEGEDGLLILAREVRLGGRSVARVNGRAVAQALLAEIGGLLVDIHGQGQHLSLLNVRQHIQLLDRYADLEAQRAQVAALVAELRGVRAELERLRQDARETARRIDLLTYQAEEIEAAGLADGEDVALESERRRLANAESLASGCQAIYQLLGESGQEIPPALDQLGEAVDRIEKLSRLDPDLAPLHGQAEDLFERLADLARAVADYGESINYDPERLAEVEERLDMMFHLKRKYGDTIAEVVAFGQRARRELETLSGSEARAGHLEAKEESLLRAIGQAASDLSQRRKAAGKTLAAAIEVELADLRMGGTAFQAEIVQAPDPSRLLRRRAAPGLR